MFNKVQILLFSASLVLIVGSTKSLAKDQPKSSEVADAVQRQSAKLTSPRQGWDFKFRDFVIGAWWGPRATDAEVLVYKEAGFNLAMAGRYMWGDDAAFDKNKPTYNPEAGTIKSLKTHLDLLDKHKVAALIDVYYLNYLTSGPWWNDEHKAEPRLYDRYGSEPNLSVGQSTDTSIKWLNEIFGNHPALAGYLLGDDKGELPPDIVEATHFLRKEAPQLLPWVCQNVMNAQSLAEAGNPIMDPQMYPTLYQKDRPASEQARLYCQLLQQLRQDCLKYNLIMWPMFNSCGVKSDSLTRFQIYSSLAYGAQGIWNFHYEGGFVKRPSQFFNGFTTIKEMKKHLSPTWHDAKLANKRTAAWGPKLLGRIAAEIYQSEETNATERTPEKGRLVEKMNDNLLVGILYKADEPLLAMVVDKRVSIDRDALAPRQVKINFADTVTRIDVLEAESIETHHRNIINLTLPAGGGQLLKLQGDSININPSNQQNIYP
ncbi:hypothetical protein ACFL1G_05505 [Planctomycetota bacterium]